MVKITTGTKLKDIKGEKLDNITIGSFLSEIMWNNRENQARSYTLAVKFATEKVVELKVDDIVFVRSAVIKLGAVAGLAGQIFELLEPESK